MVLKDIMAISGESGLFKFIAQGKNAVIVEHLETKKRTSAFGSARISSLEEISIFTEKEDLSLGKVFDLIYEKEKGGPAIDFKSEPEKLKAYFNEVLPEYDKDRVYSSDIKKVIHWYNILQQLNLLVKEEPEKKENNSDEKSAEKSGQKEPKKAAKAKKEKVPEKGTDTGEKKESAPKKKPARPKS